MKWLKKGLIYKPSGHLDWAKTHAMIPTPFLEDEKTLRIYISSCDSSGISRVGYIDVNPNNPKEIISIAETPILDVGLPGTFDENGVVLTAVLHLPSGATYIYYVGFELGMKIRYRLLTGLSIRNDHSVFKKIRQVPILERSEEEYYFRCGTFVILDNQLFKCWYVAGNEWQIVDGKSMPKYKIKYLESKDGINWADEGQVCIDIENEDEYAFGRPYVVKENDIYKMFYSIRKKKLGYRLGYAESSNGIDWVRKDHLMNLDVSEDGWDSQAISYSAYFKYKDKTYLFYNGNNFGESGFGYAELEVS
jgi:hypothetical protein